MHHNHVELTILLSYKRIALHTAQQRGRWPSSSYKQIALLYTAPQPRWPSPSSNKRIALQQVYCTADQRNTVVCRFNQTIVPKCVQLQPTMQWLFQSRLLQCSVEQFTGTPVQSVCTCAQICNAIVQCKICSAVSDAEVWGADGEMVNCRKIRPPLHQIIIITFSVYHIMIVITIAVDIH